MENNQEDSDKKIEKKEEIKFPFDSSIQTTLLELIMLDQQTADKAFNYLKPELFSNVFFGRVFSILEKLHSQNKYPTKIQLKNEILKITNPKESAALLELFERITAKIGAKDFDYVKKNLEVYCKQRLFHQFLQEGIKNQTTHPDKQLELIDQFQRKISEVGSSNLKIKKLDNLLDFIEDCKNDVNSLIPTYLPTIDHALGGGCPRGTLAMAIGGTNVGKSIWLINWAYHLIMNGYKVFYVNLEGYEKQVLQRLIARAIRTSTFNVKTGNLTEYQKEALVIFENRCKGNFQFFHNDSFDMTIESFIPAFKDMVKNQFKPDVVIYDYGQLFKSKKNHDGLRHEQAYCHRAITSIASELDHLAVTVAQGQRDTNTKSSTGSSLVRMTDISECFEINRAAATVFTLNRSEKDEEMERIKILMDKQRDGKKGVVEFCKTDFNTVAMYGTQEEGLGYINMQTYLTETGQKAI